MSDKLTPIMLEAIASPDSGSAEQEARDRLALIGFAETERRIANLEAELAEANIAVGLTGYDHREDVTTPAQCIYALWSDHTNLRELHAMQGAAITSLEADLAAAREREAALAAALGPSRTHIALALLNSKRLIEGHANFMASKGPETKPRMASPGQIRTVPCVEDEGDDD